MKFNKIKDKNANNQRSQSKNIKSFDDSSKTTTKIKKPMKRKKKFYKSPKEDTKVKTKVVMPKRSEDVSVNWLQMLNNPSSQSEAQDSKKLPNKSMKKNTKKVNDSIRVKSKEKQKSTNNHVTNITNEERQKEKFKLKRKLKRERAKLNTKPQNDKRTSSKQHKPLDSTKKNATDDKKKNLWFEVDQIYLDKAVNPEEPAQPLKDDDLIRKHASTGITKCVGIDCEMVGVGPQKHSALARVSIVNQFGHTIYDKYVLPEDKITDYRTKWSGIRPEDLVNGLHTEIARQEVEQILRGKMLVGHAIHNDLTALGIKHPKSMIRDTSIYFKKIFNGKVPSLKRLSETLLNVKVQIGEHSSVEDAKVAMRLYTLYKKDWELSIRKSSQTKNRLTESSKTN